jgi:hypothetical protein
MQNAGRGIWRKFSGLSRERRDGWSPYEYIIHESNNMSDYVTHNGRVTVPDTDTQVTRITHSIINTTPDMMARTWTGTERRGDELRAIQRAYIDLWAYLKE